MSIRLGAPRVDGSTVRVSIDAGKAARYLVGNEYWAEYDGIDLNAVDPSLLVLPALGTVLPLAYAIGCEVQTGSVDRNFAEAAEDLAPVWGGMYPTFRADYFRLAAQRQDAAAPESAEALMLFSGGLDSVATLLSNRDRISTLLSVWGADVPLDDEPLWRQLNVMIDANKLTDGLRRVTVRSNLRGLLDEKRLIRDFLGLGNSWWGGVQHGMALLALCAPVTAAFDLSRVYMASSHSAEFNVPWGSSPTTDNRVRWSGVDVVHDSYELTRQGKIDQRVAPYLRDGGSLNLAVCYQAKRGGDTLNCGKCEKCLRTASGLLAAGADPFEVGLPVQQATLDSWQYRLSKGKRFLDANERFMWTDIKRGVGLQGDEPGAVADYLAWIRDFNFNASMKPPETVASRARDEAVYRAKRAARRLPKPIQTHLKRLIRR